MSNISFMHYDELENFSQYRKPKVIGKKVCSIMQVWFGSFVGRKTCYSKIEKIRHKTLKLFTVSQYTKDTLGFLVTEIYKSISQINPEFMWSYFTYKKFIYSPQSILHCFQSNNRIKKSFYLLFFHFLHGMVIMVYIVSFENH